MNLQLKLYTVRQKKKYHSVAKCLDFHNYSFIIEQNYLILRKQTQKL